MTHSDRKRVKSLIVTIDYLLVSGPEVGTQSKCGIISTVTC
jgi:hypothetical protein